MYDVFARQVIRLRDLGRACATPFKGATFLDKLRASCTVNSAIDASTAEEAGICGIDNGVYLDLGDVVP